MSEVVSGEFPDDVEVSFIKDEGKTGNFEVKILNSDKLIHSKVKDGKGRCETTEEQQGVLDAIQEYIDSV